MSDDRLLRTLRAQAWDRAKGELHSMRHTFWGDSDEQYLALTKAIMEFIEEVEDNGLEG
jgi:hypothetical protein